MGLIVYHRNELNLMLVLLNMILLRLCEGFDHNSENLFMAKYVNFYC